MHRCLGFDWSNVESGESKINPSGFKNQGVSVPMERVKIQHIRDY